MGAPTDAVTWLKREIFPGDGRRVEEQGPRGDVGVRRWAYAGDEGGLYMVRLQEGGIEHLLCGSCVCVI